ncbi:MAG TPA: hypothetical protein VF522_19975, partial [Ramlibacter sp.]|uniref:hypothetical protein n=1 Tax=Ramlibacter sp. TaxID=1917967 RepID=UPI002ED1D835
MTAQAVSRTSAHRVSSPPADAGPPATCLQGSPWPLGATLRDGGVNFAVFASSAERVEICLFDAEGLGEERRIALSGCT